MDEMNKAFYGTLDYFIYNQGFTRARVCAMLGRSKSTLNRSKKQAKKITWISVGLLLEILELLNVSPLHFFDVMWVELKKIEKENKKKKKQKKGLKMIDNERLLNYIHRVEYLEEERSNIQSDIKEVFIEAESEGFDPKAIKYVIKCRKMSPEELAETDAINEAYRKAINL